MLPEIILDSSPPQESDIVQVWEGGLLFLSGNRFYHTEGVIEVKDCLFISKINENKNIYKIGYKSALFFYKTRMGCSLTSDFWMYYTVIGQARRENL